MVIAGDDDMGVQLHPVRQPDLGSDHAERADADARADLGAREELLSLLSGYAQAPTTPAMIMVTHHVEEIPVGFTHVLLLRDGEVVASGPLAEALTAENLTATFGVPITLTQDAGRYAARATS